MVRGVRFAGMANALPSKVVRNQDVLDQVRGQSTPFLQEADLTFLLRKTASAFRLAGTDVRYHRAPHEKASDLCVMAGRAALEDAEVSPLDVDLLIYVGVGRGFLEPATANTFQDLLGLGRATCFDLLDACASWLRAIDIARTMILAGSYRTVMILNGEFTGRESHRYEIRSPQEFDYWFPGVTIGEAATATILTGSDDSDDFSATFRNYGAKRGLCMVPLPNVADYLGERPIRAEALVPFQFMSFGRELFELGTSLLIQHFNETASGTEKEWNHIFGHAASNHMCTHIGKACNLDIKRFHFTHQDYGNVVSASVPLAMSIARAKGQLKDGDRTLVLVASAGMTTAVARFVHRSHLIPTPAPRVDLERPVEA